MKTFKTYKEYSVFVSGKVCNTCSNWKQMEKKHSHDVIGECSEHDKFTYNVHNCNKYIKKR